MENFQDSASPIIGPSRDFVKRKLFTMNWSELEPTQRDGAYPLDRKQDSLGGLATDARSLSAWPDSAKRSAQIESGEMNSRHAAALALMGWQLLCPPLSRDARMEPETHLPISKWGRGGVYDSEEACMRVPERLKTVDLGAAEDVPPDISFIWNQRAAMEADCKCLRTDDPRLKEK
jgi:hypothetical protein